MDSENTNTKKQIANATYLAKKRGKYISMINSYRFRVNKGTLHNIPPLTLVTKDKSENQLKEQILIIQNIIFQQKLYKMLK
jgi:hypothetical protein